MRCRTRHGHTDNMQFFVWHSSQNLCQTITSCASPSVIAVPLPILLLAKPTQYNVRSLQLQARKPQRLNFLWCRNQVQPTDFSSCSRLSVRLDRNSFHLTYFCRNEVTTYGVLICFNIDWLNIDWLWCQLEICAHEPEICGMNLISVRKNEPLWLPYASI